MLKDNLDQKLPGPSKGWIFPAESESDRPAARDFSAGRSRPEFIGRSKAMQAVLEQIEIVAPTQASVLILGETGTGKELVARAIHELSRVAQRALVKVNCAAIPSGLLESDLFGHEKGAFTGAIARKMGRLELADKGTLFLDEIGDFPLALQPKLLRVLQEGEYERVGCHRTHRIDVRFIAATSRNLAQMVADQDFRSDLYYRLKVFPIRVPPLREHPSDIPLLVWHFVGHYARELNRSIGKIPSAAMTAFESHSWPGNIRELQNFIHRAVILSPGRTLQAPLKELEDMPPVGAKKSADPNPATLQDLHREHILKALIQTDWKVGGRNGAAALLGLNRTTLQSKMQKLGISRHPEPRPINPPGQLRPE
ncbi:MAG TPA: sigma 54-interacting transcriptional regulator [Candidatus Methylacidiphilales bacterium]